MNDFGRQQGSEESLRRDFGDVLDVLFQPLSALENPIFEEITRESGAPLEWNFVKFLVDDTGRVVRRYGPGFDVDRIVKDVRDEL